MPHHIRSLIESDLNGTPIDVECHLTNGLPAIIIVGYANRSVDEARERLRSAFHSSHLPLPLKRITINLAPGDIPKDGTSFDLAMATAILCSQQPARQATLQKSIIFGELSLDGTVRPIRGIIGKLLAARNRGLTTCLIPVDNLSQAQLVPGIRLVPIASLTALQQYLSGQQTPVQPSSEPPVLQFKEPEPEVDLRLIGGQAGPKRALEIAAAGRHHLLFTGPPGTGKTMLAKALPGILPPLQPEEVLAVTQLHSLAAPEFSQIIRHRPFRSPHHSISLPALIGGSNPPVPGELSLSHHGVLFLDELPEFQRASIEALRQPLEEGVITITRHRHSRRFPCQFMLVATANPCPCGFYDSGQTCRCRAYQIARYQQKLSGPILDRFDLSVAVDPTEHTKLLGRHRAESSQTVRQRVMAAQAFQHQRQRCLNGELDNQQLERYAQLEPTAQIFLDHYARKFHLSARGYLKTIKVARTIADLAQSSHIQQHHLTEALTFRYVPPTPL